jgi:peptide-N4-(N-acetyl-beta-glucosaminyl)asparagine amidase
MSDKPHRAHRTPAKDAFDADSLTKQFEQLMRDKKFANLQEQSSCSRTASPAPSPSPRLPSSRDRSSTQSAPRSAPRQLPIVPSPPQDPASIKFGNLLHVLSVMPTKYENPGLLDEALTVIPLDRLYSEADEEHQVLQAQAASVGKKPEWGYQDCVIQALLK